MSLNFFKIPSENLVQNILLFGGIRKSFKVREWTSCLGRYICVHVRMRVRVLVCEHVKKLRAVVHKVTGSGDVQYPSLTGNKTGLFDVIKWEIQKENARSYMEIHSVPHKGASC
jgi:hypothetical protein